MLHTAPPVSSIRFYSDCPYCGQGTLCPPLDQIPGLVEMTEHQKAVLEVIGECASKPELDGAAPSKEIFDAMYSDDPDGGPDTAQVYAAFQVALRGLREALACFGVGFEMRSQKGIALNLVSSNPAEPPQATPPICRQSCWPHLSFPPDPLPLLL
jgi:hypothetical protein